MPATDSDNVPRETGPRWWDLAINVLVPAAFVAAMISYTLPFGVITGSGQLTDTGLSAALVGLVALTVAPLDPFFWVFSLPVIAAFVGLIYRRPGWVGSLVPIICALAGLAFLGYAFIWEPSVHYAYGLFAAEGSFAVATVASAVRLIGLRRDSAKWDAQPPIRDEPAASAQQELLARYRKNW